MLLKITKMTPQLPDAAFYNKQHENTILLSQQQSLATKYATVVGLLYLEILHRQNFYLKEKNTYLSKYFNGFINWLKELS